jgi:hypothetical protein
LLRSAPRGDEPTLRIARRFAGLYGRGTCIGQSLRKTRERIFELARGSAGTLKFVREISEVVHRSPFQALRGNKEIEKSEGQKVHRCDLIRARIDRREQ